jgi:hypothetical protein
MSLPSNFSSFEHLQSTWMRVLNEHIRDEFRDLVDDDDLNIPRSSLRVACRPADDDSALNLLLRILLLYLPIRKAQDLHPPIYGIPADMYQESMLFKPQVQMHFIQDWQSVPDGKNPVRVRVSFRLQNETPQTFTPANAQSLANAIKTQFMSGGGYRFTRGKKKYTYIDKERGYNFSIFASAESEAREVISKTMTLRAHTPEWERLTEITSGRTFPENPGTQFVYGKTRQKPRVRPTATVRFQHAEVHIHGLPNPIILADRTGHHKEALARP